MNIEEVRRIVGKIKGNLFKNSNSYAIGMLKSHFRGTGLQFKEHQVYMPGDDVRFIDWKLLAKMNVPYVKTFEEERNVEITVVIDAGLTMYTGFKGVSKLQAAIEICCLLYLLASETNDYVHVLIVKDKIYDIPKMNGDKGIIALISQLKGIGVFDKNGNINIENEVEAQFDNNNTVKTLMKHIKKMREVVLMSDFNDFIDIESLKRFSFKKHVHCFQIISPLDEAEKIPYSLFFRNSKTNKMAIGKVEFEGDKVANLLGKNFKKLKVHERYLEDFIKEML